MCGKLPRGGRRRIKIDDEMIEFFVAQVEEKPTVTLRELNQTNRVQLDGKPHVSEQAISKRLDGLLFTVKMVRAVAMQWNTATWLLTEAADDHKVFVDEF